MTKEGTSALIDAWQQILRLVQRLVAHLLNSNGFGEIAGLIDVAAAAHGDVIGKQLQRDNLENRRHEFGGSGNFDYMIGSLAREVVAIGHDRNNDAVAGFHFLDVAAASS